jgi:hypothetical protein
MDTIVLAIVALAFLHFIYEGIIAPSIRMKLRNDMFALRDELRHLHVSDDRCSREAFDVAHSGINQYLDRLHGVTLSLVAAFKHAYRDEQFRKEVEHRRHVLATCQSEEMQGIVARANQRIEAALATNCGMWFVYVVPIAIAAVCVGTLTKKVHRFVSRLFATTETRTNELIRPAMRYAA